MITEDHIMPPAEPRIDAPLRCVEALARKCRLAVCVAIVAWAWQATLLAQSPPATGTARAIDGQPQSPGGEIQWVCFAERQDQGVAFPPDAPDFEPNTPARVFSSTADRELDDLKKRLDALEKTQAKGQADKKPEEAWIDVSSEKWTVKLGGHVQMDFITWPSADPAIDGAENYFSFRRLRLVADGTGYGKLDFRLQLTLEPGLGAYENQYATPEVKDAYLSMNDIPWIGRFRIGNFFVPFGLEQVTNDTYNVFLERSIPTQSIFTVDREIGAAVYNCSADQNFTWSGGIFFDDINDTFKTRLDGNQGCRLSGRVTWLPYYDEPSNGRYLIHTGAGILYTNDYDDRVRFRARPQVQRGPVLIDSGSLVAGTYVIGNLELAAVCGPVTWQNEAYLCRVNGDSGDVTQVGGAYSHLSYFLTGENRTFERFGQHGAQFARNKPFTNFFVVPGCVGWGAWEAKGAGPISTWPVRGKGSTTT